MGKSNLLTSLSLDIETFKAHLKRISKEDYKVHQLDKDLLLEKTRKLYDNILQIEVDGKEYVEQKKIVEKPIDTVEQKILKEEPKPIVKTQPPKQDVVEEEPVIEEKPKVEEQVQDEKEDKKPDNVKEEIEEIAPKKEQEVNIGFKQAEESLPENTGSEAEPLPIDIGTQPEPLPQPKQESTYDLFSPSSNTVSDKFATTEDKSIASKLQQNKLSDLRDAIGINEKFLFINELFNGDMGRYNKALDEINSLQSKVGSDTYIMELKIEKQWDVESDAFKKFKELVDRKFI
ncbi:MAG: hypothetical protein C0595_10390 [Marinilabiliales bacterium]|nr:MAG: hypothetical protein C0595_10390 [Marinilabiliales bacterium]